MNHRPKVLYAEYILNYRTLWKYQDWLTPSVTPNGYSAYSFSGDIGNFISFASTKEIYSVYDKYATMRLYPYKTSVYYCILGCSFIEHMWKLPENKRIHAVSFDPSDTDQSFVSCPLRNDIRATIINDVIGENFIDQLLNLPLSTDTDTRYKMLDEQKLILPITSEEVSTHKIETRWLCSILPGIRSIGKYPVTCVDLNSNVTAISFGPLLGHDFPKSNPYNTTLLELLHKHSYSSSSLVRWFEHDLDGNQKTLNTEEIIHLLQWIEFLDSKFDHFPNQ